MTRNLFIMPALAAVLLSACGAPTATAPAATTSVATAAPTATAAAEPTAAATAPADATAAPATAEAAAVPAFPVTIKHKFGSTTITAEPKRIVTVGLTDHDALLALGIVPVGVTEWFGNYPSATWPWAQDKLGNAKPEVVGTSAEGVSFEKIAALKPDLILALYSGVTEDQYKLLAQIAPTVAQPGEYVDYGISWQELTATVGKAVGKEAQAQALIKGVEDTFAATRAEHPEFEGKSAMVAMPYQGIWVYSPQDPRARLLTMLGFTLPDELGSITGSAFGGNLSMEKVDLLNVDALIWLDAKQGDGPLAEEVYTKLPVHTEGREVLLSSDSPLGGATSFISVLSLPYLLDGITPMLSAAVDGKADTAVPTAAADK